MRPLTVVSLFAGVGGFDLAFQRAGAKVVAAVEIDASARAVLARRFPETALFNDVTKVSGDDLRAVGFVPERGIITGGFPCQDVSVAGRRAGLAGSRTGLFWHIVRLLDELHPTWVVLENVPGLLSSNDGADMGAVVGALGELGYGFAYRVLDAKYFGVPQQRRRVFIVGHLGTPFGAAAQVLLEPESGVGDSAQGGTAGERTAGLASVGAAVPSEQRIDTHTHTHTQRLCRAAGSAATGSTPNQRRADISSSRKWVAALTADGVGTCGADDNQAQAGHLVESKLFSIMPMNSGKDYVAREREIAQPLMTSPVGGNQGGDYVVTAPCLTSRYGKGTDSDASDASDAIIVQPVALRGREGGVAIEVGEPGAPAFALRTGTGGSSKPVAFMHTAGIDLQASETVAPTIKAGHDTMPSVMVHENQRGELSTKDTAGSLNTGGGKPGQGYPTVIQDTIVRRLTPLECERLQGFPDDWTDGQSDAQRYRQMGNSLAVPVVEWIANRIVSVDAELNP